MKAKRLEISAEEAEALLDRVKSTMVEDDYQIIKGLIDTHRLLGQAVTEKAASINRLLRMIFGDKTEKTRNIRNGSEKKTPSAVKTRLKAMAKTA